MEQSQRIVSTLILLGLCSGLTHGLDFTGPFRKMFPKIPETNVHSSNDTGNPLFLTPLLNAGKWKEAQMKAKVDGSIWGQQAAGVESYAGYFTVNSPDCDSNMFFWYFPAEYNADTAPVLLWLQGGPGGSSLFGLFNEHGPLQVTADLEVIKRSTAWSLTHHVIYIDNPVGTGFSFTKLDKCYAKNQDEVGMDLYFALQQFFDMFPKLRTHDFYVTGESYAGKYVPAITYKIHTLNPKAEKKINLKGMAIGDGLCDPITMGNYGDFLFNIGLLDELDRDYFKKIETMMIKLIQDQKWIEAFRLFDSLLNGDLSKHSSYFTNATGFHYYFNYLDTQEPKDHGYYNELLQKASSRKAIHVGNLTYNDGSKVEQMLLSDIMKSVKPWIEELMETYKVMIYNGQLDVIIAWPLTESFITSMKWSGAKNYTTTPRSLWHVGGDLAGYVKQIGHFTQVLVRNAGHMVPYDQPKWSFDLINRFTSGKKFD